MSNEITANQIVHGFKLLEKRFVKEVNAECFHFEHMKSGASLLKIAANDPNKTFAIVFKTFPDSDKGTPHILEHSVLNGSKSFPVKSPFDVLRKGSLNTFINAFTAKDYTMYPIASMNEKDYFNLMHVYLDAVFFPKIYSDERILKQEGWHLELMDMDSPLQYSGVVYNEMKGAFSNPLRELQYHTFKSLYPDNPYGFESGGHPESIVNLTYQEFIEYHRKNYHPSNCRIFLYGDGDLNQELEFINNKYLINFERQEFSNVLKDQPPFDKIKDVTAFYSLNEGNDPDSQTFLSMSFVAGKNTDIKLGFALNVLVEVLFNQESAPVRLALEKAGIGKDISAMMGNLNQILILIMVQNANPDEKTRFAEIVQETLTEIAQNGVDREAVAGIMNLIEFHLREGDDAQKGLMYAQQVLAGWMFSNDPFRGLEWETPFESLKTEIKNGLLEQLIYKYFIRNTHGVLLTLIPQPGLEKELTEKATHQLAQLKLITDRSSLEHIIDETHQLIEFQQREDKPEDVAKIPMIKLEDIKPDADWHDVEIADVEGVKVLFHEEFANNVVYSNLYFDLKALPQDLIQYASLLSNLLGLLGTKNYDFAQLNKAINIDTGGISSYIMSYPEDLDNDMIIPKMIISGKAMNYQAEKFIELLSEIALETRFDDYGRLKSLIGRIYANLDATLKRDGYQVASKRLLSYFNHTGVFNEMVSGLDFYWFVSGINANFDEISGEIVANLQKVAGMLFKKSNLLVSVTSSRENFERVCESLKIMAGKVPDYVAPGYKWQFDPQPVNEGIQAPSKVQYVVKGYNFKKLGHKFVGTMKVLNQIISTEWFQKQIRVIGGAYGGFSSISPNGNIIFSSYRDPNLEKTLDTFDQTVQFIQEFDADIDTMTRFIIGTIARNDHPLTPSEKGETAFRFYFSKITLNDLQEERMSILKTTVQDIRNLSVMIKQVIDRQVYCVYGDETKIADHADLFGRLVNIGSSHS